MSRVLVTGATGFVGRRVLAPLRERGFEVHAVARHPGEEEGIDVRWHTADLLDDEARPGVVQRIGATYLLHLAWYAEHGRFWTAPQNGDWVAASVRLAREFVDAGGRRAVMAGTCAEYDWEQDGPFAEDLSPLRPATFYGASKDATRRLVEHIVPELAWGRIFFLYGPGEHPDRLVASVARALVAGERAPTSAGTQRRDFLHVDDVAGAFAALVAADATGAVNVASGEAPEVREVVRLLGDSAGRPELLDVGALPARPDDPPLIAADVRRLRDEVGFTPTTALRDGLEQAVRWWEARR